MRAGHLLRLFPFAFLLFHARTSWGQCTNNNTLSGSAITVACPGSISGGCILGGQYALVNVTSGNIYTFSFCSASWNTLMTLFNNAGGGNVGFNDDACNGNRSAIQWTATFTGQLRVLVDRTNCTSGSNPCAPLWITCSLNDDPCTSTVLTVGASCSNTVGSNDGATAGGVANPSCGSYSGGDVWYRFVAPASGRTTISTSTVGGSSLTDGAMAVYSVSTTCSSTFTQLSCNDNSPLGGNMPYISLTGLTAGTTYYVRFWENGNDAFGTFNICAYDIPPPANDDPCAATALTVGSSCTNTTGTNVSATSTAGIPAPSCGSYSGGDVWFTVVAPASGQLALTGSAVGGSSLTDGAMAVYSATACGGTYTQIACNDDSPLGGVMPYLELSGLTSGTTYYVRFWEYGNNAFGQFNICATTPTAASNDNPCTSTSLTVGATCTNITSTTSGASNTTGVSTPSCGTYLGSDVWFTVVVPASGKVTITTSTVGGSSLTDAAMAVYSASACGGTMTEVGCIDNPASGNMPMLTLSGLTVGATYYVRVWSVSNSTYGQFNICANEPAVNDEPCDAIALTVGSSCTMVLRTNVSATATSGAPAPGCGTLTGSSVDVWYSFTAPASGIAIIESTAGTLTDGSMALYTSGTCASSTLSLVQCSADEGTGSMPFLRFSDLVPGATYFIRYWGSGSASGTFNLCVWSPTIPAGSCTYFLELFDSGENGWGTSAVQVQVNSNPVVNYTVASGYYSNAVIGLNTGDVFQVTYVNSGPNQNQNRYQIRQIPGGYGVFMDGPSPASGLAFLESTDCVPPDPPNEDCRGSTGICGSQAFNDNPNGTGFDVDLRATTFGCLSSSERQGTWYKFSPSASGTIGLTITPSNLSDDYDFAVWGPESSVVCPPHKQPKRCSYSGSTGTTGLRTSSTDTTESSGGDKWVSALTATTGEIYVLYISNFSQSGLSFSLSWQLTGGASLDCSLLPVGFIDLQAELINESVEVQWSTAAEENASHYIVERSTDAVDYLPIGTVQAMGNTTNLTTYTFLDEAPIEGLNYYRVQQVDMDGRSATSPADYAVYRKASTDMVVFPNPAGDILFASFEMPEDDAVIWRIIDASGRLVEQDLYQGAKGNMLIDVPLERLANGSYTLLVNDQRGRMNRSAHFVKH